MSFPFYKQHDQMDCGPTCLRIISKHYGKIYSIQKLREYSSITKSGVSLLGISEAAEKVGFRTLGVKIAPNQLEELELPCILHWRQQHFVVLHKIKRNTYFIADPAKGLIQLSKRDFLYNWLGRGKLDQGIALCLSPTPLFYELEEEEKKGLTWTALFSYRLAYKKLILQLFLGLIIGSILQFISPFFTQAMVDIGINTKNIGFLNIILIAQVMLTIGSTFVGFVRSWIMLHMTTRINVSILTDFIAKMMRLPMTFFDSKRIGDIMLRMSDHSRIEGFLTGTTLNTLFSLVNMVIYAVVIAFYNVKILIIFLISTCLSTAWIYVFMRRRRELDYKRFENSALNQTNMVDLINGAQEIKLHGCEQQKRWEWENIQARIFRTSMKGLALSQYQQAGSSFINQAKNVFIIYLSAKAVIEGELTLGGMMALQFMVGQLTNPIGQLLGLFQGYQDAKMSLERLNEIHGTPDEEHNSKTWRYDLPAKKGISIKNLTFTYPGAGNEPVLENVSFDIPEGKTTAIVGMSGSGKTTLLKLLLRFYEPQTGEITVGDIRLDQISFKSWRKQCGIVMQEGFVFSDTIAGNISIGDEKADLDRLEYAIKMANIQDFINSLPLGTNTLIGAGGNGTSQGQKQRLLIARAVYKDPHYILFDEATNALDAINERVIMENLEKFFKGRTVIVVAHRLSTVKNADNIIVLDNGKVIEQGSHSELINKRGEYYTLVKNQLELGN